MNIASLLSEVRTRLPGESPALDAQILLAHVLGQERVWLLAHPEATATPEQVEAFRQAIRKLEQGAPLPYVLGHWEFFGLDFVVTPEVLIPRPETELLVETALEWLHTHRQPSPRILDVGTGSGCIAIVLATRVPEAKVMATDISPKALAVARRNAQAHGVLERVEFVECDLLPDEIPQADIITANLPYIPTETLKTLPIFGREPTLALEGSEPDGLGLIRRLLARLTGEVAAGSLILLEIENRQGAAIQALARQAFPAASIRIQKDLAGLDRLAIIAT